LSRTQISETARIHPSAYVSRFKVKIGSDCVIGPHAVVYENSILDDKVDLAAGCVVGSEGLVCRKFAKKVIPIRHRGGVHIHRGVRIGPLSCVNKSEVHGGYTEIGEGSCIGEEVLIGHNAVLGRRCHVESHTMIAGSVVIGDDVRICRNSSISNRLIIGNSVRVGPGAVVNKTVQDGKSVSGNFAIDSARHREFVMKAAEGNLGWLR
jgi:UDP-3-O-[3-hydroxymyristoyl] glucosamine N-acyltransferase